MAVIKPNKKLKAVQEEFKQVMFATAMSYFNQMNALIKKQMEDEGYTSKKDKENKE